MVAREQRQRAVLRRAGRGGEALGRLSASPAVDALAVCVSDRSWWVRHHAAYALAVIGAEGHDALCDLAARAEDPYAREMAKEALESAARARQA